MTTSKQKNYLCEYTYKGERWAFEIPADSWDDAEARLRTLSHGQVSGELIFKLPARIGWLARLGVRVMNFIGIPAHPLSKDEQE